MWVTGIVVLVFLVFHVNAFFVQSRFFPTERTMYEIVRGGLPEPAGRSCFYLVALAFLAYHLRHGFQSAFQTFGLRNSRYKRLIESCWPSSSGCSSPSGSPPCRCYFLWAH